MAGKSKYSDEQRAQVYVVLRANDNNVKRTARESGVPENTVRRWRDEWANGINIPSDEAVQVEANGFVERAEEVRDFALNQLVLKIPDPKTKASELITIVGVLDDKISRARGIDRDRNLNVKFSLPSPEEIQELMGGFVQAAIAKASDNDDIIDGILVEETKSLPA